MKPFSLVSAALLAALSTPAPADQADLKAEAEFLLRNQEARLGGPGDGQAPSAVIRWAEPNPQRDRAAATASRPAEDRPLRRPPPRPPARTGDPANGPAPKTHPPRIASGAVTPPAPETPADRFRRIAEQAESLEEAGGQDGDIGQRLRATEGAFSRWFPLDGGER